jgi:prepilin-type N-terminal cleavage/methylation domain-containing protein
MGRVARGVMRRKVEKENPVRHSSERGFSLIETIIAMAVLTFGLVSVVGISAYISRANSTSNAVSVLATSAQDQVDVLRSVIWTINSDKDARLAVGGSLTENVENHYKILEDTPAGDIIVRWVVAAGPGTTGDVRTVTIKVVQDNAVPFLQDGYTVTTVIHRN